MLLIQLAVLPPLLIWAEPIVDLLLGSDYEGSVDVVRLLAPFVVLGGLAPLLTLAVNYAGEARLRIPVALTTVLVTALVNLALIDEIGAKGAAVGADAGVLVYVAGHLWICARLLGIRMRRSLSRPSGRCLRPPRCAGCSMRSEPIRSAFSRVFWALWRAPPSIWPRCSERGS